MVAYAAVVSLLQNVDRILHPGARRWRIFHNKAQLKSLHEKVSFLLDFLENSSSHCGRNEDPELKSLEKMIRVAAHNAKYIIESDISNQVLAETETISFRTSPRIPFLYLFILLAIGKFYFVDFHKVIAVSIQTLTPVPISVQSLLPFTFQSMILNLIHIVFPCLIIILSVISAGAGYVTYLAVLKGISFTVRYWLYASQSENQDLRLAIDDISSIMEKVTNIKDACGSRQSADSGFADGLYRLDFRGTEKSFVEGLDDSDLNEINARLLRDSHELEIVSIVGMGGIGKTTLARRVHDAPYIVDHFDICAWVTVTQEYALCNVILGLLESAKIPTEEILMQNHEDDHLDQRLGEHLCRSLMWRRYLIVVDDVWDIKIWDFVKMFFPEDNNGSRVLLTTRLSEVASYATCGSPPLQMQFLTDGYSWNLLEKYIFGEEGCPSELEDIGKTIARNCGGLPLAIVVVGGLLYNEHRTLQDWTRVSRNLNSILSIDGEQCLKILGLSYDHLPHRLKPCFLYMGAFREDEEIRVTRLFNLWAAEGFLETSKSKNLEGVAEEYLEDLIQRSLILVGQRSCNGKIKTCKIHDIIRDVCLQNARKENFLHFGNWDGKVGHPGRGLTDHFLAYDNDDSRSFHLMACSFICVSENVYDLSHIYLRFRLLRVLDVVQAALYEFPDEIFELFHLRYLGLTHDSALPPSISQLCNLQTIVFHNGRFNMGVGIPREIWSMPNLRHLYFTKGLLPNPPGWRLLGNNPVLENLQSLVGILHFRCTKGIIKRIPNVKRLEISYDVLSSVEWSEYELESLVNLCQLETLKMTVRYKDRWTSFHVHPPKLAFPEKLKKLSLSGCRIPWESMRIVGALPNLQVLKLRNYAYEGQIWEPVEEQFCQLEFLLIDDTDLEHWSCNETHFPRLQSLLLRWCRQLNGIPSSIGEISTLQMIQLVNCHPSAVDSAKRIQEEQESMGNVDLKVLINGRYI